MISLLDADDSILVGIGMIRADLEETRQVGGIQVSVVDIPVKGLREQRAVKCELDPLTPGVTDIGKEALIGARAAGDLEEDIVRVGRPEKSCVPRSAIPATR